MKPRTNVVKSGLAILMSVSLLSSCSSDELSSEEATALISQMPNEIVTGSTEITVNTGYNMSQQGLLNDYQYQYNTLVSKGILTSPQVQSKPDEDRLPRWVYSLYRMTSTFTDSAKALILDGNVNGTWNQQFVVKSGELKFVEVVGVFQEKNSRTAQIEYLVAFVPTMFADISAMNDNYQQGTTYQRRVTANKYDTGWRIEN